MTVLYAHHQHSTAATQRKTQVAKKKIKKLRRKCEHYKMYSTTGGKKWLLFDVVIHALTAKIKETKK